jgi:hypothetical protein
MVSLARRLGDVRQFNPLILIGGIGCLGASLYLLIFDCASCSSFDTGVPIVVKTTLVWLGVVYGAINILGSKQIQPDENGKTSNSFHSLVLAIQLFSILVLGWLVAVAASGIWRLCPLCKLFWGFNALLVLSASMSKLRESRWTIPMLVVAISAAASPILFPDVKQVFSGYVPRESLLLACDALKGRSIEPLEPIQHQKLILVGDCAPCAREKLKVLFRTLSPRDYEVLAEKAWEEKLPEGWKMTVKPNLFTIVPELAESKGAFIVTIKEYKVESCKRIN